jgi:predicted amidohydrolase YtcJ
MHEPRALLILLASLLVTPRFAAQAADLLLVNGRVWTGDSSRPAAQAVAVRGDRIVAVGRDDEVARLRGPGTRVADLGGRFVAPGFIDNHTHFGQAGALLLGVNLLDVANEAAGASRAGSARPAAGGCLARGWRLGRLRGVGAGSTAGRAAAPALALNRAMIDLLTPATPALLAK